MPKLIALGANYMSGTVNFNNSKKAIVSFNMTFAKVPRAAVTQNDTSIANPYTTAVNKTGFTINFAIPFSGIVEWQAIERE